MTTLVKILHWVLILHGIKVTVWPTMPYMIFIPLTDPLYYELLDFIYFSHCSQNPILASLLLIKFNKHVFAHLPLPLLITLFSPYSPPLVNCHPTALYETAIAVSPYNDCLFLLPSFIFFSAVLITI